jgi:hypothetical protein
MAKKDAKKNKKDKKGSGPADTVDAVRSAVERALPEGSKERGAQIVDEVARAVTRVRESLEQHGVFDELGKLRNEVESLARRVASLERPSSTPASTTKARSTASKPATSRSRSTATKASRTTTSKASRSTTSKTRTTKKPSSSRTKSRSTSSRSGTSGS